MTDLVDGNGLPTQFSEGHGLIPFNQARIYCRLRHVECNPVENLNKYLFDLTVTGPLENIQVGDYSKNNRKSVGGHL